MEVYMAPTHVLVIILCFVLVACGHGDNISNTPIPVSPSLPAYPMPLATSTPDLAFFATAQAYADSAATRIAASPTPYPPIPIVTQQAVGSRMRDVWPTALPPTDPDTPDTTPSNMTVAYIEEVRDQKSGQTSTIFWQIDPRNPTRRTKLLQRDSQHKHVRDAHISSDGRWIAYRSRDYPNAYSSLHITTTNDTQDIVVAGSDGRSDGICSRSFVWAPHTLQLAYLIGDDHQYKLYLYTVKSATSSVLSTEGWTQMIGWRDNHHILILTTEDARYPHLIVEIDTRTQQRTVLYDITDRLDQNAACVRLSADRQHVLIGMQHTNYLIDLVAKESEQRSGRPDSWLWSESGTDILQLPLTDTDRAALITKGRHHMVALMPPYQPPTSFSLRHIGSHGRSFVLCGVNDITWHAHLWWYDMIHDQWTPLTESTFCPQVVIQDS